MFRHKYTTSHAELRTYNNNKWEKVWRREGYKKWLNWKQNFSFLRNRLCCILCFASLCFIKWWNTKFLFLEIISTFELSKGVFLMRTQISYAVILNFGSVPRFSWNSLKLHEQKEPKWPKNFMFHCFANQSSKRI